MNNPVPGTPAEASQTPHTGGVTVAAGDVSSDGTADVVTGSENGDTRMRAINGKTRSWLVEFTAYATGTAYGVSDSAFDTDGDGRAEIVAGSLGASPTVRVYSVVNALQPDLLSSFLAGDPAQTSGVREVADGRFVRLHGDRAPGTGAAFDTGWQAVRGKFLAPDRHERRVLVCGAITRIRHLVGD